MRLQAEFMKKVKTETIEISLDLENEVLGILGRSGCGKSVTLRCLAGILQPDKGKIQLNDKILFDSEKKISEKAQKRKIGYLFQNYALFPNMTVEQNILTGLNSAGGRKAVSRKRQPLTQKEKDGKVREMLSRFRLEGLEQRYPAQLSGGEQQRVSIARALAKNPKLLLCDEPTGALDYNTGKAILKLLQDTCRQKGMTVIVITHNSAIAPMADRIIHIKNGRVSGMELNPNPVPVETIEW